jgi:hypothetical protein
MGHTRLGSIPKGKKWSAVVAEAAGPLAVGAQGGILDPISFVTEIANLTLDAASEGLRKATEDLGLRYTFYLLAQLTLASRSEHWQERLRRLQIELDEKATIFDLTVQFQKAADTFLLRRGHSSDVSEMAQRAAGEAICALVGPDSVTLFGTGRRQLQSALHRFSTRNGFGLLGQRFFARFMGHFLNFYLSRVSARQLGGERFAQVGDVSQFNESLFEHCEQSARIVRDFCSGWYSKTAFKPGINFENASRFVAVALEKLRGEIQLQRKGQ